MPSDSSSGDLTSNMIGLDFICKVLNASALSCSKPAVLFLNKLIIFSGKITDSHVSLGDLSHTEQKFDPKKKKPDTAGLFNIKKGISLVMLSFLFASMLTTFFSSGTMF